MRSKGSSGFFIQSNFGNQGNFEVVAPIGYGVPLRHYVRDNNNYPTLPWYGTTTFGGPHYIGDPPALLQSNFGNQGNFEVISQRGDVGLTYYWRDNDNYPIFPWHYGTTFAADLGIIRGVSLIQSNYGTKGNFEVIASPYGGDSGITHYWRDNVDDDPASYKPWHRGKTFAQNMGNIYNVSLIQSNYGNQRDC